MEVVIAAERVIPRKPVHQGEWLLGEEWPNLHELLLVRGQHAVGVDHSFRQAGRAGGEQDLRNGVGAARCGGLVDCGTSGRLREIAERRCAEVYAIAACNDL